MNSDIAILDGGIATDDRGCVRFVNDFNFKGVKRFYQVENHTIACYSSSHLDHSFFC